MGNVVERMGHLLCVSISLDPGPIHQLHSLYPLSRTASDPVVAFRSSSMVLEWVENTP